jgi:hypothetical protein
MSSRRAKIVATTTVLGLGGLAGVALESNHGVPTQLAQAGKGGSAVVTTASGATVPASQATSGEAATTRPPIVTRASGGAMPIDD